MEHSNDITKRPAFRIAIILIILLFLMPFLSCGGSGTDGDFVDLGNASGAKSESNSTGKKNTADPQDDVIVIGPPPPADSVASFAQNGFDFESSGEGDKYIFIIDRSGSMSGARFNAAKEALMKTIERLPAGKKFFAYLYDDKHEPMPGGGWQDASATSKKQAIQWVRRAQTRGSTNPSSALKAAFSMKPSTIWLLTDGQFSESAVLGTINGLNSGKKVRINTIALVDNSGERVLKRIAAENRGTYVFINNKTP